MTQYYITGIRRGLGKALVDKYGNCNALEECDIFINCKHDGFLQVDLLYKAADLNKRIINIGSAASDWTKGYQKTFKYGIEKKTLKDVNDQLFYQGINTTIINFGFFDTERVANIEANKMSIEYCLSIVQWVLDQPHRVKDITITPYK
jgi:hypothetical protein|tara:strand:- start:6233 stop:6676 length:444 start_codon:yes stop_codon:yes gene_type:complete